MSLALNWAMMCSEVSSHERGQALGMSLRQEEDATLVAWARKGDADAFAELVRRYRNDVFGLAMHYVGQREDAWDIAQEVFVKAHRSLGRFRGDASFKTWVLRITSNQCKDFFKKRRLPTVSMDAAVRESAASSLAGPEQAAEAREIGEGIQQALGTLPHKHRTAFILREFEGMSYDEMAEAMGCNLGTVMSRLHHARRKLREQLKKSGVLKGGAYE